MRQAGSERSVGRGRRVVGSVCVVAVCERASELVAWRRCPLCVLCCVCAAVVAARPYVDHCPPRSSAAVAQTVLLVNMKGRSDEPYVCRIGCCAALCVCVCVRALLGLAVWSAVCAASVHTLIHVAQQLCLSLSHRFCCCCRRPSLPSHFSLSRCYHVDESGSGFQLIMHRPFMLRLFRVASIANLALVSVSGNCNTAMRRFN